MHRLRKGGFTLVELLVVIAIVGTLLALIGPHYSLQARERARQITCMNNLKQLQTALAARESSLGEYPGYINSLGPEGGEKVRASWLVMTLPYLDSSPLWDDWNHGNYSYAQSEVFICPSDTPVGIDDPQLSYTANAGYIGNVAAAENIANGVFFDRTRVDNRASGPADERDLVNSPEFVMTRQYLQENDGASNTLLLAENNRALFWGYTTAVDQHQTLDRKYHFGFVWDQPNIVLEAPDGDLAQAHRVNGNWEAEEYTSFAEMTAHDGFPSSSHPGVVNMAFADGNVRAIAETIDPLVYAQLMTSNHKESDLVDRNGKPESELSGPGDGDY